MSTVTETPRFPERYIGDAVYASFDGYHIWLRTYHHYEDRRVVANEIALEPPVKASLDRYEADLIQHYRGGSNEPQS